MSYKMHILRPLQHACGKFSSEGLMLERLEHLQSRIERQGLEVADRIQSPVFFRMIAVLQRHFFRYRNEDVLEVLDHPSWGLILFEREAGKIVVS